MLWGTFTPIGGGVYHTELGMAGQAVGNALLALLLETATVFFLKWERPGGEIGGRYPMYGRRQGTFRILRYSRMYLLGSRAWPFTLTM